MDREEAVRRFAGARVGRLATVTPAGRPHVVPCCFTLVGERVLSVVDAKPKTTQELRRLDNLRAEPRASLLVDHYEDDWSRLWWVRAEGTGRVVDPGDPAGEHEAGIEALAAKYPQYRSGEPSGDTSSFGALVVLEVQRWASWSATPEP
jgi:PPOX class probable F420-dependent enzyme